MMVMLTVMMMMAIVNKNGIDNPKSLNVFPFLTAFLMAPLMALAFFRQRIGRRTFRLHVDQLSTKTDQNPPGNKDYEREKKRMMIRAPFSWK